MQRRRFVLLEVLYGERAQKVDHIHVSHSGSVCPFDDVALKRGAALDFGLYSNASNPGSGPYDVPLARLIESGNV